MPDELPSPPVEQGPPTRLLLVEDNTDYALVMRAALTTTGRAFAIEHVERLEEALARLSRGGTDVILLDLALPDSTGTDTVRHVHEAAPEVPIVVLTGLTDDALAQQSIREGAQDYLVKGRVDGAMLGYAIGRAIERKRRDKALQHDEERFRQLVTQIHDHAVFLLDPAGRIVSWNAGAERITGFPAEAAVGQHYSCLFPQEELVRGRPEWALKVASAQGHYEDEGLRARRDGTTFWATVSLTALRDRAGVLYGYSEIIRDTTAHKEQADRLREDHDELARQAQLRAAELARANESLQHTVAHLERLDKLKDEFLAIVTHELRTPIQNILGFTELLQAGAMPPEEVADALAIIHQSALNQVSLINNLLEFARLKSGQLKVRPQPTALAPVVEESLRMVRYHTEQKRLQLAVDIPADLPRLMADPERLRQILLNLVGNAIKFTPAGERIAISARALDGAVEVAVIDSGIGIAPEHFDLIFQQFGQVQAAQGRGIRGTGLGLPITRSLVEMQGGRISVESMPGQGSTFKFTLPIAPA